MNCFTVTCPSDPCYVDPICPVDYPNRIVDLVFVKKSFSVNKTSKTAWLNSLLLAVVNGQGVLMRNVSGEKPLPETATLPGFGRQIERTGAKTHTITVSDRNGVVNVNAYNAFLQSYDQYDLYYVTPDLIWDASGQQLTINGDVIITNEITSYILGQLMVKWTQIGSPEACEFNDKQLALGLRYVIANTYDPSFIMNVPVNQSSVTTFSAQLSQNLSGSLPDVQWSLIYPSNYFSDWGVAIDSQTGVLTANLQSQVAVGNSLTVTVVATNQYGCVTGEQQFTLNAVAATCADPLITLDPTGPSYGVPAESTFEVTVLTDPSSFVEITAVDYGTANDSDIVNNVTTNVISCVAGTTLGEINVTFKAVNGACETEGQIVFVIQNP